MGDCRSRIVGSPGQLHFHPGRNAAAQCLAIGWDSNGGNVLAGAVRPATDSPVAAQPRHGERFLQQFEHSSDDALLISPQRAAA